MYSGPPTMGDPLVSVCIPSFNNEATIRRCLDSAISQVDNYASLEILVVDDNSTDTTTSVVESYCNIPFLRLVQNRENVGLIHNHNRCLEMATGTLVKFLHADDVLCANAVRHLVDIHQLTGASIVASRREVISDDPHWKMKYGDVSRPLQRITQTPSSDELVLALLRQRELKNMLGEPSSVLISRSAARGVGGFRLEYPQLLDLDLWLRLALAGGLSYTDRTTSIRYHSAGTATAANRRNVHARYDMVRLLDELARSDALKWSTRVAARGRWLHLLAASGARAAVNADTADISEFIRHARPSQVLR